MGQPLRGSASQSEPHGVERIRDHLLPLYQQHGRPEDLRIELFECGHEETPEMRNIVLGWLDQHLVRM